MGCAEGVFHCAWDCTYPIERLIRRFAPLTIMRRMAGENREAKTSKVLLRHFPKYCELFRGYGVSIFLRKIDLAVAVPIYTLWENAYVGLSVLDVRWTLQNESSPRTQPTYRETKNSWLDVEPTVWLKTPGAG